jgi:prepilin-type N-terminal cleavage/methylation domain-containing protein
MAWKTPEMTAAARKNRPWASGFTLIEIVMVLAIAAVVLGGAMGLMVYSSDERALRDASGEIELLAKRARTSAMLQQTPYALVFSEGRVQLMPLAETGYVGAPGPSAAGGADESDEQAPSGGGVERREFVLDSDMSLFVRRWNTEVWLPAAKKAVHLWRFDPDGLCEPLSVRLQTGPSWSEDIYHPLTATIRDSQLEAR